MASIRWTRKFSFESILYQYYFQVTLFIVLIFSSSWKFLGASKLASVPRGIEGREGEEEWEEEWEEGRGTKFIVRQTTRTSRRRKYPGAEEFVTTSSSYAPLFFFSVCGALVSRGFKRKTLRLFDARFPLPFFPVPGLITRVRQKYTRRRRKGFGGEFSARSSRFDVYLGSRNTSVYLRYNSFFTIFRQVFKSGIYDLHLARNLFIRRYNKESMSSLKYADRVMMFVRDWTMFYRSIKLQILFVDFATNTATKISLFLFFFPWKELGFFLIRLGRFRWNSERCFFFAKSRLEVEKRWRGRARFQGGVKTQ